MHEQWLGTVVKTSLRTELKSNFQVRNGGRSMQSTCICRLESKVLLPRYITSVKD